MSNCRQAERAQQILADEFHSAGDVPVWQCPKCQSENDAGFEVCWSCGAIYSDAADENVAPEQTLVESPIVCSEGIETDRDWDQAESKDVSGDELADRESIVVAPLAASRMLGYYNTSSWFDVESSQSKRMLTDVVRFIDRCFCR